MGFGAPVGHDVDGVADHVGHGGPQVLGGTVGFTWIFFFRFGLLHRGRGEDNRQKVSAYRFEK